MTTETETIESNGQVFDYYKLQLKFATPMIGTATDTSIYNEHVLEKAKKEISKANSLKKKTKNSKVTEQFVGDEITEQKQLQELQGIVRAYSQLLGKPLDVPETREGLDTLIPTLEEEYNEALKNKDQVKATVFMKGKNGFPIIPTHMVLGNLKENLRIMVNNGDKSILKSKVSVGETLALDVKFVESFMESTSDILRARDQKDADERLFSTKGKYTVDATGRVLLERPIRFTDPMGKQVTAIAMSEVLPEGTELSVTMRVRAGSPINETALKTLFSFGKSNGLGSWRGSGNMGSYHYRLERLPEYKESIPEGWN